MQSLLIMGNSGSGKTYSLRNYAEDEGFLHINTEGLKTLPFKHKFKSVTAKSIEEFDEYLARLLVSPDIHTVAIDSISYLLPMLEIYAQKRAKKAFDMWAEYGNYLKSLFQEKLPTLNKNIILTAHTGIEMLSDDVKEFKVKVKGALKDTGGIESFLTNVVAAQVVSFDMASKFISEDNPLLSLDDDVELLNRAYVAFTKPFDYLAKSTVKTPPNVFTTKEVLVNLDAKAIMDRIIERLG